MEDKKKGPEHPRRIFAIRGKVPQIGHNGPKPDQDRCHGNPRKVAIGASQCRASRTMHRQALFHDYRERTNNFRKPKIQGFHPREYKATV